MAAQVLAPACAGPPPSLDQELGVTCNQESAYNLLEPNFSQSTGIGATPCSWALDTVVLPVCGPVVIANLRSGVQHGDPAVAEARGQLVDVFADDLGADDPIGEGPGTGRLE